MTDPVISVPIISVVLPIYNELESLSLLLNSVVDTLEAIHIPYEIICVDDGSTDGSAQWLREVGQKYPTVSSVLLRRNYGQTPALAAGFDYAKGQTIVTLDSDLQNDPADIPLLLAKLDEGYDLVSGWRKQRQDDVLTRLLPSIAANRLIALVTGVHLHDYGCSLKSYRA